MDILIRNIPDDIVKKLDTSAQREGLSRNAFIIKIIHDYAACKEDFLLNALPTIVRALVNDELERLLRGAGSVENNIYLSSQKLMKIAEKLDVLLAPEIEKSAESELKNSDVLNLLTFIDTES